MNPFDSNLDRWEYVSDKEGLGKQAIPLGFSKPYATDSADLVSAFVRERKSVLILAPTGTGKSVLGLSIAWALSSLYYYPTLCFDRKIGEYAGTRQATPMERYAKSAFYRLGFHATPWNDAVLKPNLLSSEYFLAKEDATLSVTLADLFSNLEETKKSRVFKAFFDSDEEKSDSYQSMLGIVYRDAQRFFSEKKTVSLRDLDESFQYNAAQRPPNTIPHKLGNLIAHYQATGAFDASGGNADLLRLLKTPHSFTDILLTLSPESSSFDKPAWTGIQEYLSGLTYSLRVQNPQLPPVLKIYEEFESGLNQWTLESTLQSISKETHLGMPAIYITQLPSSVPPELFAQVEVIVAKDLPEPQRELIARYSDNSTRTIEKLKRTKDHPHKWFYFSRNEQEDGNFFAALPPAIPQRGLKMNA